MTAPLLAGCVSFSPERSRIVRFVLSHTGAGVREGPGADRSRPAAGWPGRIPDRPQGEMPGSSGHSSGHADRNRRPAASRRKRMSLSEYDRTAPDDPQNKPAEEKEPVFDDDSPMKKSGLIFGGRTACGCRRRR